MVKFIEEKCIDRGSHMVVVVESTNPEELGTLATRAQVLKYAKQKGFDARGLNGMAHTYPVDAQGETGEDVLLGKVPVAGHRADYQVNAGAGVVG